MMSPKRVAWRLLLAVVTIGAVTYLARPAPATADPAVSADVIGSGGGQSQNDSYLIYDTFGQGPMGPVATGGGIALQDGFWATVVLEAVPADTVPPLPVVTFDATPGDTSVKLLWANPSDADFQGTLVRYSTTAYPSDPMDGLPVENGQDGAFYSAPASADSFCHDDLTNNTTYYYTAFAFDYSLNYAAGVNGSAMPRDRMPPGQITALTAGAGDMSVTLGWTNPSDADFVHTLIRYSTGDFPLTPEEGLPVENGAGGIFPGDPDSTYQFVHTDLENLTTYYYSLFAADEVPNYSAAQSISAVPEDTEPPAPVTTFEALGRIDGTVKLRWTNPDDTDFVGSRILYSTESYPASVGDGTPVENGNNGAFPGAQALVDSFIHIHVVADTTYYYSVFTYDDVLNYSAPVTAHATPRDEIPPELSISVFQNPYLTNHLDIYLIASEALVDTSIHCGIAGSEVEMGISDPDEYVCRGDYDLYQTGSLSIQACARDLSLNGNCLTRSFSSTVILASAGGSAKSVDGCCLVTITGGTLSRDAYMLIFESAGDDESGTVYHISPQGLEMDGFAEIAIAYDGSTGRPEHFSIARLEGDIVTPVESYLDRNKQVVLAYVDRLGSYRLIWRPDVEIPIYGEGSLRVLQNIPNPFVGTTAIAFEVPRAGQVRIEVIAIDGRLVRALVDHLVPPGRHSLEWDGTDGGGRKVAGGLYLYRVCFGSETITRKMVHLR